MEPAIFGTLLERALSAKERHNLGAHFTPRAYVERLVRPTIEEPLRTEWENTQTMAHKLHADGKVEAAREAVHAFHRQLCETRVLDPACGSGNFLYVTLNVFKQIESEVLSLLADLGEKQEQLIRVTPRQFLGIEVKPWAKEIAELVLWIGYLQWHYRTYGKKQPPVPVLQDFQNIECRDAVLVWDGIELMRDEKGKPLTRWDGETYKRNPVTGEDVPDDKARITIDKYVRPRPANWPDADYVVGNPPFIGKSRRRAALGDGYIEALLKAYPEMPEGADYVMWWWFCAAKLVRAGKIKRFGLITTNSITQSLNRGVLADAMAPGKCAILWAIPNHPWVDSETGADVRIAMTTAGRNGSTPTIAEVVSETWRGDSEVDVRMSLRGVPQIHPDLRGGPDVTAAKALVANSSLCSVGLVLFGQGFVVSKDDLQRLEGGACHPYLTARDLVQSRRSQFVIDFYPHDEATARKSYPRAFQHVLTHVKPERDHIRDPASKRVWWRFGRDKSELRRAIQQLERYIVTPEVGKFRTFQFIPAEFRADHTLVAVGTADAAILGVLSSRAHVRWAEVTGSRLGVGNDLRYNKTRCFDPFPFPPWTAAQQKSIRTLGERLDAHRKDVQAAQPDLTITGMYNVLEKLRTDEELTEKERVVHERGLVSILKKIRLVRQICGSAPAPGGGRACERARS